MTNTELVLPATFDARPGYVNAFLRLAEDELPYWSDAVAKLLRSGFLGGLQITSNCVFSLGQAYYDTIVEFEGSAVASRAVLDEMLRLYALVNAEG